MNEAAFAPFLTFDFAFFLLPESALKDTSKDASHWAGGLEEVQLPIGMNFIDKCDFISIHFYFL